MRIISCIPIQLSRPQKNKHRKYEADVFIEKKYQNLGFLQFPQGPLPQQEY